MAAVGTCTITSSRDRPVKEAVFDWTTDSSTGAVSGGAALTTFVVSGQIVRITTVPGTPAPLANYDIVLNDADGVDVAQGFLQNRHTTNTESVTPVWPVTPTGGATVQARGVFVDSTLEVVVSNANTNTKGKVRVYYL